MRGDVAIPNNIMEIASPSARNDIFFPNDETNNNFSYRNLHVIKIHQRNIT